MSKSSGQDLSKANILKKVAEPTVPVLSIIFKVSSQTGRLPSKWKEANTKAIYKKEDKHDHVLLA